MARAESICHLLICRQLFYQFVVDMDAKIESERVPYIRFNQQKFKSVQYRVGFRWSLWFYHQKYPNFRLQSNGEMRISLIGIELFFPSLVGFAY